MAHQSVVVQTSAVPGLICPVSVRLLASDGGGLDFGVEQGVERHSWFGVDGVVVGDGQSFEERLVGEDRKSTRLNSSHVAISYAVFCLKKKITVVYSSMLSLTMVISESCSIVKRLCIHT